MANSLETITSQHPFIRQVIADKIRGLIIGSALGDAIGLYTEFLDKSMCAKAYPEGKFTLTGSNITRFCNDSHRNKFFEGSWTDDTDHSLLIVLSYLHSDGKEISSLDLAKRLRSWVEQGLRCLGRLPLGLGQTMGRVIVNNTYLDDPKARAFESWVNGNFTAAPNGSLMRTHPLGILCMDKTQDETFAIAIDFSQITHADPRCLVSCCIATALLRGILLGQVRHEDDIDEVIENAVTYMEQQLPRPDASIKSAVGDSPPSQFDKQELYKHTRARTYQDLELDDLRKQGYVYKCLGSALFCLRKAMRTTNSESSSLTAATGSIVDNNNNNSKNNEEKEKVKPRPHESTAQTYLSRHTLFEELITELIMQGGDADTNATTAGALLGAYLGFNTLPAHWYTGLRDIQWLMAKTSALIQVVGVEPNTTPGSEYIGSQDRDTRPDGGKGFLTEEQLKTRELAFMEVYLTKTGLARSHASRQALSLSGTSELFKKLQGVFR